MDATTRALGNRVQRVTRAKREHVLRELAAGWSISRACREAGIDRVTFYKWKDKDPEFAKQVEVAVEDGTDILEDAAHTRAVDGVAKPIYQGGEMVGTVQEYSDQLTMFLLKGRRPDKFRERSTFDGSTELKITVSGGLGPRPVETRADPKPAADGQEQETP